MVYRVARALPLAALLLVACGCIEATQVITLNPDGTARVEYDALTTASAVSEGMFGEGPKPGGKKLSLDERKRLAVVGMLTNPKGGQVAAWKNVKADWAPDGRLHVKATAYFDRPEDLLTWGYSVSYALKREGGGLKFVLSKKDEGPEGKKEAPPDVAKMTDRELDDYLLQTRVEYQEGKAAMALMFADLKVKTVVRLPGPAGEVTGFKAAGRGTVAREIDGSALVTGMKKVFDQDNATLKATLRKSGGLEQMMMKLWPDASVTVPAPGAAQFDYAKEVAAARAAYPALRREHRIDAKHKLPGEKDGPAK
jgi:hypothetical protein